MLLIFIFVNLFRHLLNQSKSSNKDTLGKLLYSPTSYNYRLNKLRKVQKDVQPKPKLNQIKEVKHKIFMVHLFDTTAIFIWT